MQCGRLEDLGSLQITTSSLPHNTAVLMVRALASVGLQSYNAPRGHSTHRGGMVAKAYIGFILLSVHHVKCWLSCIDWGVDSRLASAHSLTLKLGLICCRMWSSNLRIFIACVLSPLGRFDAGQFASNASQAKMPKPRYKLCWTICKPTAAMVLSCLHSALASRNSNLARGRCCALLSSSPQSACDNGTSEPTRSFRAVSIL